MMQKLARYWHTLKYLKLVQIAGRVRYRLCKPRPDLRPAPVLVAPARVWQRTQGHKPSMKSADSFVFLGEEGRLSAVGWDGPQKSKLWRYNQHYFDDLNADGAAGRHEWHEALLHRWVAEVASGTGNAWEPYPVSLRIVNWLKWHACGNVLPQACVQSLAVQARWLSRRLEWHLLGNHLFVNAKALVMAGLAFEGAEARAWLRCGLDIIGRELPEQVLADGGNFELSPMYHAIFLEDLLDLIQASEVWPGKLDIQTASSWRATASRMLGWLDGMTHTDGDIALFNDAASGIAPLPRQIAAAAGVLGIAPASAAAHGSEGLCHYKESGYIRVERGPMVALLDVAKVGPDYLPGHAHADTLSFEMSVHGQRVVVNGGTSRYGLGPERERERSTASHSTVEVDGCNSSEVWSGFRVARRAFPFDLVVESGNNVLRVACSHNGYSRLPGKPIHRRMWELGPQSAKIRDVVTGPYRSAVARFLFHPAVRVKSSAEGVWELELPSGETVQVSVLEGRAALNVRPY
ncbi:MAG: hypothetical protein RLZZ271_1341, partial [Pseudomonadota bacterium]